MTTPDQQPKRGASDVILLAQAGGDGRAAAYTLTAGDRFRLPDNTKTLTVTAAATHPQLGGAYMRVEVAQLSEPLTIPATTRVVSQGMPRTYHVRCALPACTQDVEVTLDAGYGNPDKAICGAH